MKLSNLILASAFVVSASAFAEGAAEAPKATTTTTTTAPAADMNKAADSKMEKTTVKKEKTSKNGKAKKTVKKEETKAE